MITQEFLLETFSYHEGELYWDVDWSVKAKFGSLAGDTDGTGYRRIMLDNQHYKMHRLIWIMHFGEIPADKVVDHINMNKSDNRIENLRLLSKSNNNRNRTAKGYSYDKSRDRWRAQISVNNRTIMIGRFKTEEEAKNAYEAAKAELMNQ